VLAERGIIAHVDAALPHGAEVHACERVEGWDIVNGVVRVRTDRGEYGAHQLILTAGPWTRRSLPSFARTAVPERQVLIWTQPKQPSLFTPGNFPIFNMEDETERWYGFPIYGVPGFKFGKYGHLEERGDPEAIARPCDAEDERVLREGIARYFPEANGDTLNMKACLFTNSPDGHFIIGHLPDQPQVTVAAGFSGHGYKFCSVVGEILADLALDGQSRWNIDLFRLDREALLSAR
jgi:sarcosine oxidase